MNSGATAERVHQALKARIMAREFRPGARLDPALLAGTLASSVTPVRDALHLLTGEGLVETRVNGGFHLPQLDEPGLRDLYDWSADVIGLAIRSWQRTGARLALADPEPEGPSSADRIAAIFRTIARRSANSEHVRAIERLNARLHAVRMVEPHVLGQVNEELAAVTSAATAGESDTLRRLSASYHRRRRRAASDIVRAVYRT